MVHSQLSVPVETDEHHYSAHDVIPDSMSISFRSIQHSWLFLVGTSSSGFLVYSPNKNDNTT
eukprot:4721120-Amphidinium_carterae.1